MNPCGEVVLEEERWCIFMLGQFQFLETSTDGTKTYSVQCSDEVVEWLREHFVEGTDFTWTRSLKGVWINMPEDIFIALKLKWL